MFRLRNLSETFTAKKLMCILSATALLTTSISIAPSAAFAQERTERKLVRPEERFNIKRSDLIAKKEVSDLPLSPVEEDNRPDALTASTTALTRSINRPDIHGETSIQNFQGTQKELSNTHASASGFREFLEIWYPTNFHHQDTGVSSWLFHDYNNNGRNYDLWTNSVGTDLGIDSVRAAYHSSHGTLINNVFYTSLGANWDNTGWWAQSNLMALGGNHTSYGDERLRYMFWDTCNSVMISGGNDPYTTWGTRSKGIRFVFGYETISLDSPNYGKFFWEEWSKGKTFKSAFLDASWRINTGQSPALVAFGATSDEAFYRRDNERLLYADAVSNNWAAWSWYYARQAAAAPGLTAATADLPQAGALEIVHRGNSNKEVMEIAQAFGIGLPGENAILSRPAEIKMVRTNAATLTVEKNGNFELILDVKEDENNTEPAMSDEALIARAQEMVGELNFIDAGNLRAGMIRDLNENTGSENFTGQARVTEKTIIFDQTVNGTPFIDPEAGHLEITFGARTGQVKRVRNTLQKIVIPSPDNLTQSSLVMSREEAREVALGEFRKAASANTALSSSVEIVDGSEAVGYQIIDGKAVLVYRAHLKSSVVAGRPSQILVPLVK